MWEQKGEDKGRWTEYVNERGESSIKEHKLRLVWKSCKPDKHRFELTGNREVTCTKCGMRDIPLSRMQEHCGNPANLSDTDALNIALGYHDTETKQ